MQQKLQAQQCRLRMFALLSLGGGSSPLTAADACEMTQLIVQINHGNVFIEDNDLYQQLSDLLVQCHDVMAKRAGEIIHLALKEPDMMTQAVSCVLQRTPDSLPWQQQQKQQSFNSVLLTGFEAVGEDGHLYSINVLDGTVLLDGLPPSRLPRDILEHYLYVRTFGDNNFEIVRTASGVLQTIQPVQGCFYDFSLCDSGKLVITELDKQFEVELELLDVGSDGKCGSWGSSLPVRLQHLHSHWLCR